MIDCNNFVHFMAEDDEDLDVLTLEARDEHARNCDECFRLQRGYRAYLSHNRATRKGSSIGTDAPWVKENLVKAANAAIDRMEQAAADEARAKKPSRARVAALVAMAVLLLAAGVTVTQTNDAPTGRDDLTQDPSAVDRPATLGSHRDVAPIPSQRTPRRER